MTTINNQLINQENFGNNFVCGVYKHYKGNLYRTLSIGKHTETEELMVVYHAVNDPKTIWIRPLTMFLEQVDYNGQTVHRFIFMHA